MMQRRLSNLVGKQETDPSDFRTLCDRDVLSRDWNNPLNLFDNITDVAACLAVNTRYNYMFHDSVMSL